MAKKNSAKISSSKTSFAVVSSLQVIELGKTLIYESGKIMKSKYMVKNQNFHMDSFTVSIKADGIYKDIAEDVETRYFN